MAHLNWCVESKIDFFEQRYAVPANFRHQRLPFSFFLRQAEFGKWLPVADVPFRRNPGPQPVGSSLGNVIERRLQSTSGQFEAIEVAHAGKYIGRVGALL